MKFRSVLLSAVGFTSAFLLLLTPACDDRTPTPDGMQASQGTYVGVIHLSWGDIQGQAVVERRHPETGQWQEIGWCGDTHFDDTGYLLPDDAPVPGQRYEYRMRAHTDEGSFSGFTDSIQGYAYEILPVTELQAERSEEGDESVLTWVDPNDHTLANLTRIDYEIHRAEVGQPDDWDLVDVVHGTPQIFEKNHSATVRVPSSEQDDASLRYKVAVRMWYEVVLPDGPDGERQSQPVECAAVDEGEGPGPDDTVPYDHADLGVVVSSSSGSVPAFDTWRQGSSLYLAAITDAGVTGYGAPAVYRLDGDTWSAVDDTLSGGIADATSLDDVRVAAGNGSLYVAGVDLHRIYVHESDGSAWSGNLVPDNFGDGEAPSAVDIAVQGGSLYAAVKAAPDYDVRVHRYTGSVWETVGGDAEGFLTSGKDVFNLRLETLQDVLYLVYTEQNSAHNHTLRILHLEGSSWVSDLSWTADNITRIRLTRPTGGALTFVASSESLSQYPGGVYAVTSGTTVENLVTAAEDWFIDPRALTLDSQGNLIVVSIRAESSTSIHPILSRYDGSSWKLLSGDFSGGTTPVDVIALGDALYYTCGEASTVNSFGDATVLRSEKLTP